MRSYPKNSFIIHFEYFGVFHERLTYSSEWSFKINIFIPGCFPMKPDRKTRPPPHPAKDLRAVCPQDLKKPLIASPGLRPASSQQASKPLGHGVL